MSPDDIGRILILIVLLYLSSFFSSAETALTTVNRHRLRFMADEGNARAALVLQILDQQSKMLTAILIGNNIVNLTASALTTVITSRLGGSAAIALGTGVLTFLILIFGEITPKTLATLRAERMALSYAAPIHMLMQVLTPLIFLVNQLSRFVLKIRRIDPDAKDTSMTEDELRTIVEVSHEEGVIESDEKEMINNVFDLGDSQARDVMVPRVDVVFADVNASYEKLMDIFRRERFTRIPIYEESPDQIIGIMNMKDLVLFDQSSEFHIRDFLREANFTHEFKSTNELFHEMRRNRTTMSIVLDEYGVTVGIITMEDIVEEIVGEIRDEFDEPELEELKKINEYEYIVEGSFKLDDLNDRIGTDFESEDYDSVGGYIIGLLDHFPETGESCTDASQVRLVAEKVEDYRIELVHLYLPGAEGSQTGQSAE